MEQALAEGKTITVGEGSLTIEQHGDTGLDVGGIKLNTNLPWYLDALMLLGLIALVYVGKKFIDKRFERKTVYEMKQEDKEWKS
jgi:hypothetical protein